jgi:hypothetical protein
MKREHILDEIRRIAKANGGAPPGWRKFISITGIKQSDCLGKHWARWSDALRDAGFESNELDTGYENSELIQKYAHFARELGRLPTHADMRFKTNADPEFPTEKPYRRFGAKKDFIKAVREYCATHAEYDDVLRLCETYTPRIQNEIEEPDATETEIGFVYLMKSGKFFKIGKTNAVGRREYEIGIQMPDRPTTIHIIRTDDPTGIEEYWHKRFEKKRKGGEWFALDSNDVSAFKRRTFM